MVEVNERLVTELGNAKLKLELFEVVVQTQRTVIESLKHYNAAYLEKIRTLEILKGNEVEYSRSLKQQLDEANFILEGLRK